MSVCKKMLSCTLALAFLLTFLLVLPPQAKAATSGTCGDNLTWTLDDSGTLTISGTGEMYEYGYYNVPPWDDAQVKI